MPVVLPTGIVICAPFDNVITRSLPVTTLLTVAVTVKGMPSTARASDVSVTVETLDAASMGTTAPKRSLSMFWLPELP
ncbi:hypothetical protein D3C78_1520100 [compost metagenome]